MRTSIFIILLHFSFIAAFGQNSKADLRYKPINLDEAVLQLKKNHHDTVKQKIITMTEDEFIGNSHLGLGMWIRNNWKLWRGGKLSKYFNSIGIYHPDDMSGIILISYYRDLKGLDKQLDKQVKYYQDYWRSISEHFNK